MGDTLRFDVAALYVSPTGPYPRLVREWWDVDRDARTYAGPWPVVAHPPCGPWGKLRHLCKFQDPSCGPAGVASVRRWGGVLEHPEYSRLWDACRMPRPGELPDAWGGRTYRVNQVAWGHKCVKPTWIYAVGVDPRELVGGILEGGTATHVVTSGARCGAGMLKASRAIRITTPIAFARWLVSLASAATR